MNDYKPWLNEFRTCMINYQAKGYYDATNLQQAFESGGAFDGGIIEDGKGGITEWSNGRELSCRAVMVDGITITATTRKPRALR